MHKVVLRIFLSALLISQASCVGVSQREVEVDFGEHQFPGLETLTARISNRSFPSVFQAWNGAEFLNTTSTGSRIRLFDIETRNHTLARHDLVFQSPEGFDLNPLNPYPGLNVDYTAESIQVALSRREAFLNMNPQMVFLAEIRYHDAPSTHLPDNHVWWKRDWKGDKVPGWEEGEYYLLDFSRSDFQNHIALQCLNIILTGVVDGCMFDWWEETSDRIRLLKKVRKAIGREPLILVNAGNTNPTSSASYINGIFMEGSGEFWNDWFFAIENLKWAEETVKPPRINVLEAWYQNSRNDFQLMRAVTTLVLTQSDGYVLFGDPNSLPAPDHLHDWYPFWNKSLGQPLAKGNDRADGGYQREFERGTVVFNPPGNAAIWIDFDSIRTSLASQGRQSRFLIPSGDGDIFLK